MGSSSVPTVVEEPSLTAAPNSVWYKRELDNRLECQCKKYLSHLGLVFLDGPSSANTVQPDLLAGIPQNDPRGTNTSYLP
jgi:hypothetical protein